MTLLLLLRSANTAVVQVSRIPRYGMVYGSSDEKFSRISGSDRRNRTPEASEDKFKEVNQ